MSALEALNKAREAGLVLRLEGDGLTWQSRSEPPSSVLQDLARHKADIVSLLRGADGWNAEDWRTFFEERAAISEMDGKETHPDALARAFECCVAEWLRRNPVCSPPDQCAYCASPDSDGRSIVPFGCSPPGHVWLHADCWQDWFEARKSRAIAALVSFGIPRPAESPKDFDKNGSV